MNKNKTPELNPDPITDEPGSHPVGTGVGAAGGGAAGAAVGAMGGPVGAVVGAAIGAVAGGLAGKGVAEAIDPTVEDAYWRENHERQPYAAGSSYDEYAPAYRLGYQSYDENRGRRFEDVEGDMQESWMQTQAKSRIGWEKAKRAARAGWDRVERAIPGDADHDGK
jgi:phage tail tape-measure protein